MRSAFARKAAKVTARYIAPVSSNRQPRRSAKRLATVLFPAPAGPSIVTTRRIRRPFVKRSCRELPGALALVYQTLAKLAGEDLDSIDSLALPRFLLHDHDAVHDHPMTWKRTQVRIFPRLFGSDERDRELVAGRDDVGVRDHLVELGDVVSRDRVGIGDQLVAGDADLGKCAGFDQYPIMRHDVWVDENQLDRLAGPDLESLGRESQILTRLDGDRSRSGDGEPPRVRRRMGCRGQVD